MDNKLAIPLVQRGPETEIQCRQEVELIKATLAAQKIHLHGSILEKALVIPRDIDRETHFIGYPSIKDELIQNLNPKIKKVETKKKKKTGSKLKQQQEEKIKLEHNEKFEYKPFHVGNYPLRKDGKPLAGVWRLILPSEADWTDKPIKPLNEDLNEKSPSSLNRRATIGKKIKIVENSTDGSPDQKAKQ